MQQTADISRQRFVSATQARSECLRAFSDIAVAVSYGGSHAQVPLRIGTLKLKTHSLRLAGGKQNICVQPLLAVYKSGRNHLNIDKIEYVEPPQ